MTTLFGLKISIVIKQVGSDRAPGVCGGGGEPCKAREPSYLGPWAPLGLVEHSVSMVNEYVIMIMYISGGATALLALGPPASRV